MIALLEGYRHAFLGTRQILLRGVSSPVHLIEGRELAFPDPKRQMPVVPGWIGGRIPGIDPGAVLHMDHIGSGRCIAAQILIDPHSGHTAAGIGDTPGIAPGLLG